MIQIRTAWLPAALALAMFGCDDGSDDDEAGADMGTGQSDLRIDLRQSEDVADRFERIAKGWVYSV